MNPRAEFDVGPLSWVKGEIDLAIAARPGGAARVRRESAPTRRS